MTSRSLFYVFVAACACTSLHAAERCALRVIALTSSGSKVIHAHPVSLIDESGNIVIKTWLRGGEASICDFGFGRFSLLVGPPERCGSIEVKRIRYLWSEEQVFRVVMDTCKGEGDGISNGCEVLLRVRDPSGKSLSFPILRFSTGLIVQGFKTGLIIGGLHWHEKQVVEVSVPGYVSQRINLECGSEGVVEKYVTLTQMRP